MQQTLILWLMRNPAAAIVTATSVVLSGCFFGEDITRVSRNELTTFKIMPDGFEYKVNRGHKEVGLPGVASRDMEMLESWLLDKPICPNGYEIVGKSSAPVNDKAVSVIYQGRCKAG
jgi:hypothetical protein